MSVTAPLKVLIIEDSSDDLALLLNALKKGGFNPDYKRVQNATDLEVALKTEAWQVVISDYSLPTFDARRALEIVLPFNIAFFVYSGTISEALAVELMRAGAQDYVMKGNPTRLIPAIYRELDEVARRQEMQARLKQKEEQLRQSQKMEAIGRLAGGIAHDFNNFLGAMKLMTELMGTAVKNKKPIDSDLTRIHDLVESASSLTRQLLLFSRKQVAEVTVLDLNQTVGQMQKTFGRVLGGHISFKIELAKELSNIRLDKSQLEQTVMNLIVNAKDAMPKGGNLCIRTLERRLESEVTQGHCHIPPGEYVMMVVEDTGHGMSSATLERIFEPFFTTKGSNGTGLGLATVFGIVQNSGGYITVRSQVGVGTAFEIYFPVSAQQSATAREKQEPQAIQYNGSQSILLVEDGAEMRDAIAQYLTDCGHRVFKAESSLAALAICETNQNIDLLLTDLALPEVDGIELIRRLRADIPTLKIILMSGFMDDRLSEAALPPSEIQFLHKPFSFSKLVEKIHILFAESSNKLAG